MNQNLNSLSQKALMIVFTYAPAGLGHMRVTDALYEGLPKNITPVLLGSQDTSISNIHRLTSVNFLGRKIMEMTQRGLLEDIFAYFYRSYLRANTQILSEQMLTLLDQRLELAKTVLVVSTHFGLAHQIAAIKEKLQYERKIKVFLAVQVTDDSPQHMWYVPDADLIFVPSEKTKQELLRYGKNSKLKPVDIIVSPYPVSLNLREALSQDKKLNKELQSVKEGGVPINIAVPVSGAAVQLSFFTKLLSGLFYKSDRFKFHIISRAANYTKDFLSLMISKPYVRLHVSDHYREVVNKYEEVYKKNPILLEITKPSEQAFKALLSPNQSGGAILLFSEAVGRQEYDNLAFLQRHKLIPTLHEHQRLWHLSDSNQNLSGDDRFMLLNWRGLILPNRSAQAIQFIWWCLNQNIFRDMLKFKFKDKNNEIADNGVSIFWEHVSKYLIDRKTEP